ncbi:type VII secretion protein EccB [Nocardioides sp. SOB77]|uniref:Type VII secretion protein EccB n=1 Tax=Nocardioides oceani TaxID=3058369 RepID=A0ABT8FC16_9ACTN|nr:type VII secretion protein EccB [Nocardioides oceani]MDN4171975.1 type VII secretion protein EccB [Nocardioides oceani]
MATKKDLVEAHSFSRRRLVTAFVSGAPGGREVEPTRPGRTVVGGVALAILLVAGAAIAAILNPKAPTNWTDGGLVISGGTPYVILDGGDDPELRPVINITSAQLILGPDLQPSVVDQSEIDKYTVGEDIGILGAPSTVPDDDQLLESPWTACTADGSGIKADLSEEQLVEPLTGAGMLVRARGRVYLIAESAEPEAGGESRAYSFLVPDRGAVDLMLQQLGMPIRSEAVDVPEQWLALFPAGGPLSFGSFGLEGYGEPSEVAGQDGLPAKARVGDRYESAGIELLVTRTAPVGLTPFAAAVYASAEKPAGYEPRTLQPDGDPQLRQEVPAYEEAHWPEGELEQVTGEHCAVLLPDPDGGAPTVRLGTAPEGEASVAEAGTSRGSVDGTVDAGRGAYVLSAGWDDRRVGTPYLLDHRAVAYALVGDQAAAQLGYGGVDAPIVPDTWVELFEEGVPLSVNAALCPPDRPGRSSTCE